MSTSTNKPKTAHKKATKKRAKRSIKKGCSVCGNKNHIASHCPDRPIDIIRGQSPGAIEVLKFPREGETAHYPKCQYDKCDDVVYEHCPAPFCCRTCETFYIRDQVEERGKNYAYEPRYATEELYTYLRRCEQTHQVRYKMVENNKESMTVTRNFEIPSFEGYAAYIGRTSLALRNWTVAFPEFRRAMMFLLEQQKLYLLNNGLAGMYHHSTVKLMLMNNHGMREKKDVDVKDERAVGIVRKVYEMADDMQNSGNQLTQLMGRDPDDLPPEKES